MNRPAREIASADADYPRGLLELADPPELWVLGRVPQNGLAIVGSRNASETAARFAFELARRFGTPVISGLALGIDGAAHRGALAAGLPTLAYVGTGIDLVYPPEHDALREDILAAGGGIATEQPPGTPATDATLRQRDRLQAAHARGIVLVVTEPEGGAMHTMRFARGLARPRFALEPNGAAETRGNALAIADGARPLPWDLDRACTLVATGLVLQDP